MLEWSCTWNYHQSNFLCHNLHTCSAKSKEQAYKALVRLIVEYSATVWDPYVAKNIQQVEMIQSCLLNTLELRRSDACLCMLYKQSNGLATYECIKLQRDHESRMDTRLSSLRHRLKQARCTCDYYKNFFYPTTIVRCRTISHQKL